jgi:hypothetical protein
VGLVWFGLCYGTMNEEMGKSFWFLSCFDLFHEGLLLFVLCFLK